MTESEDYAQWLAIMDAWETALAPYRDRLEREVLPAMWDRIAESSVRGLTGSIGDVAIRTYTLAGRTMLTFAGEGPDRDITFIGADRHNSVGYGRSIRIGLHTIGSAATIDDAIGWLTTVLAGWPTDPIQQHKIFGPNPTARIKLALEP